MLLTHPHSCASEKGNILRRETINKGKETMEYPIPLFTEVSPTDFSRIYSQVDVYKSEL